MYVVIMTVTFFIYSIGVVCRNTMYGSWVIVYVLVFTVLKVNIISKKGIGFEGN